MSTLMRKGGKLLRRGGKLVRHVPDCIAHWMLEENAGDTDVVDSSNTGQDGTASTNTTNLNATGKLNDCFEFVNANNEYVNFGTDPATQFDNTKPYSWEMWVKLNTLPSAVVPREAATLICDGDYNRSDTVGGDGIGIYISSNDDTVRVAGHDDLVPFLQSSTVLNTTNWYHILVTYDGSGNWKLYVDDIEEDSATGVTPTNSTEKLSIGSSYWDVGAVWAETFDGKIDNVRIFEEALNTNGVAAYYNGGTGTETTHYG